MRVDISKKAQSLRDNKKLHEAAGRWQPGMTVQEMALWEKAQDIAKLNGKDNKKHVDKSKKDSWEWTYASSARQTVRMARLTDFCTQMFTLLLTTEKTLNQCCSDSYKHAFSAHHPYVI